MGWVRLGAPDVALAEAAIGAGIAGALLLATWARLPGKTDERPGDDLEGHERENETG
jgi:hypothetical protein